MSRCQPCVTRLRNAAVVAEAVRWKSVAAQAFDFKQWLDMAEVAMQAQEAKSGVTVR
ncbi:hypothetical protein [Burkholderia sp. JP2-270]|uniref:hypothetical protein n=1 Tax=Burkholderia sp. JP2-270 TaxID=2217913 RepID=UPI0013A6E51C|nr:hypothetical protein [Burkholderia sp. JP2-270]